MTKNTGPLVILLARWLRLPATQIALLTMVWALVALTNLGGATLWDIDEGNNAEASREMRAADNWVVPTFNYQLRVDKPALINWLQILCGMVFGEGEFAARFPSALAGLATVLAVWLLGRLCLGGLGGLLSAFVLLGCPLFVAAMRFANPDSQLTALVSWCLVCFFLGQRGAGVWWLYGAACASGLAMLAKGPVGLAMPGAIILVHLLLAGGWLRIPWRHLAGAFLVWLAVAGPWYLWVGVETKFAWHKGFFLQHNLGRLAAPMEGHGGPVWYYLPILLAGTFPFSTLLLLPALVLARRRTLPDWWPLLALGCAWVAVPVVVFSLSRTKLPNYVLPAYPGLALLLAAGMTGWRRGLITAPMGWVRLGMGILAVAGVAVAAGFLVGAPSPCHSATRSSRWLVWSPWRLWVAFSWWRVWQGGCWRTEPCLLWPSSPSAVCFSAWCWGPGMAKRSMHTKRPRHWRQPCLPIRCTAKCGWVYSSGFSPVLSTTPGERWNGFPGKPIWNGS